LTYCAAAARETVMSVSPVESEIRCRWKTPAADVMSELNNLSTSWEKATA